MRGHQATESLQQGRRGDQDSRPIEQFCLQLGLGLKKEGTFVYSVNLKSNVKHTLKIRHHMNHFVLPLKISHQEQFMLTGNCCDCQGLDLYWILSNMEVFTWKIVQSLVEVETLSTLSCVC